MSLWLVSVVLFNQNVLVGSVVNNDVAKPASRHQLHL